MEVLTQIPGIDVNEEDGKNFTALSIAMYRNNADVVKILASVPGIKMIGARESNDQTPLTLALYMDQKIEIPRLTKFSVQVGIIIIKIFTKQIVEISIQNDNFIAKNVRND